MNKFDHKIDRKNHNSIKWTRYPEEVLPMWVADMDFEVAQPIQDAIQNFMDTKIYGYAMPPEELYEVIIKRFKDLYDWEVKREWIVLHPSVVSSIFVTCRMISLQPYSVMTSVPVYYPFMDAARGDGRNLQAVDLIKKDGKWTKDFDKMAEVADESTKLYILCNPHNPTGRIYTEDELNQLVDFCVERDILLLSDEIHADIIMDESQKHIPVAALSEKAAMQTVSLFSSGKAYNMPGINSGFAIIPNPELREKFVVGLEYNVPRMNKLGGDAALAAFRDSNDWLEEVLVYLRKNHEYLYEEINKIDGLKMDQAEATFLAWINYEALGIDNFADALEKNGLGVQEAEQFGAKGHIRLNFGTQFDRVQKAVEIIKKTAEELR